MTVLARTLAGALAVSTLVAFTAPAQAGDWKNTAEIYLLGAGISGTTAVGPAEVKVSATFDEILSNLQAGAMVNYRGESRTFAVSADVMYSALGSTVDGPKGFQTAEVDAKEWLVTATANYRASEIFDVFAGLRLTSLTDTLVLTAVTGNVRSAELSETWIDPIVGARVKAPIGKGWSVEGYGDIGGFGVGSDLTWMLQARVNWQASKTFGLGLGYRVLYQDYSTGSGIDYFRWKITTQGPLVAVNVSF
jgi:hypothetical protein